MNENDLKKEKMTAQQVARINKKIHELTLEKISLQARLNKLLKKIDEYESKLIECKKPQKQLKTTTK